MQCLLSIFFSYLLIVLTNWKIGLAILPTLMIIFLIFYTFQPRLDELSEENLKFNKKQSGYLRELIGKYKTVLSFGNFEHEQKNYKKMIKENYNTNVNDNLSRCLHCNSPTITVSVMSVIIIFIGCNILLDNLSNNMGNGNENDFKAGQVSNILIISWNLESLLEELIFFVKRVSDSFRSAKNYYILKEDFETQKLNEEIIESKIYLKSDFNEVKEIVLSNVTLDYNKINNNFKFPSLDNSTEDEELNLNDSNVSSNKKEKNFELKKINVKFKKFKLNYLLGESGSGKTSILSLILKLIKPTKGNIYLDKKDINDIDNKEYLSLFGYVPQESIFYDISVKDNIKFFRDEISDQDVLETIELLNITFINNLKDGIDSKIGTNGCELSGGQRQMISIARALVKKPKILLLDEFTSNLDNILSIEVEKILKNLIKKIIVIVITHKLNNINYDDKKNEFVYLQDGEVYEDFLDEEYDSDDKDYDDYEEEEEEEEEEEDEKVNINGMIIFLFPINF